jgi:hypothetical protein
MDEKSTPPEKGGTYGDIVDLLQQQKQQQEMAQREKATTPVPTEVLEHYMVRIIRLLGDGRPMSADQLWEEAFRLTEEEGGDPHVFQQAMVSTLQILVDKNTVHIVTGQDDQRSFVLSPEISSTL